jgi:hypothetical protein
MRHVAKLGNKKVNPRPHYPSQATMTANAFLKLPKEIIASLLVPYHRFIASSLHRFIASLLHCFNTSGTQLYSYPLWLILFHNISFEGEGWVSLQRWKLARKMNDHLLFNHCRFNFP